MPDPGLADYDVLAQSTTPAKHRKKALPMAEQCDTDGEGEKGHSLQGDCVGSGHRPLNLQVPPAADNERTVTSFRGRLLPSRPSWEVLPLAILANLLCPSLHGSWHITTSWGPYKWFQGQRDSCISCGAHLLVPKPESSMQSL